MMLTFDRFDQGTMISGTVSEVRAFSRFMIRYFHRALARGKVDPADMELAQDLSGFLRQGMCGKHPHELVRFYFKGLVLEESFVVGEDVKA